MPEDRRISPAVAIIPIGLGLAALVGLAALAWAAHFYHGVRSNNAK